MCVQDAFQKKSSSLQNHWVPPNFHFYALFWFYWCKDLTLLLSTFVWYHCNRWNPWFQVRHLNLLQEGKVEVQLGDCFLHLPLVSAFLCALVSFSQPGFLHIVGNLASRIPMLHVDGECTSTNSIFPGKESYWTALDSCSLLNQSAVARKVGATTGVPCQSHLSWVEERALIQRQDTKWKGSDQTKQQSLSNQAIRGAWHVSHLFIVLVWITHIFDHWSSKLIFLYKFI